MLVHYKTHNNETKNNLEYHTSSIFLLYIKQYFNTRKLLIIYDD